jgi:hypothetical protein
MVFRLRSLRHQGVAYVFFVAKGVDPARREGVGGT